MEQPPAPSPAPKTAPAPAPRLAADRTHWTPHKQRAFLIALLETGNIGRAARTVGMSRSSAHRLRQRLAGTPFDRAWAGALAVHADHMANPFAPPVEQARR